VSGFIEQLQVGLFTAKSRVLQFASFGFDSAIEQILATILAGGCVCIPQEEGRLQNLTDFIRMFRVNLADLTPSVATLLNPEEVPSLEVLRLSGESVDESLPLLSAGHARVENSYGPSECCVTSLTNQDLVAGVDSYNIGRAIGCQAWVVDPEDHKKLIAIGAIGELIIQGPIVARGYIGAVGNSSTAFFESPTWFQDDQLGGVDRTDRCYRTGDLVRYATDGTISFIGRKDNQVKLRGQRIELEEIEHQILRHSEVAAAHIAMPSKGPCANELVALVQHNNFVGHHVLGLSNLEFPDQGDVDMLVTLMNNLREFLTSSLPHFMIPTEWVPVKSLPLISSGKTNRRAATAWLEDVSDTALDTIRVFSAAGATSGVSYTTGTTVLELIRIVADVVGETRSQYKMKYAGSVTLRAAGLDSISVVSLLRALRHHFNVDLVMSSLHWDMIIQGLANIIDGQNSGEESYDPVLDLSAEIRNLQVEFGIAKGPTPNDCRSIFLTGATGYLGTQILRALLESDPVSLVIVLVREWDVKAATERLIIAAKKARWWCDAHLSRIEVWLGDLSKPRFELLPSHWERLMGTSITGNIDAIIHNGAIVNWFGSYQALKPANTNSTAQLIQALQSSYSLQRLVYVSGGPQWDPNKIKPDDDDTLIARINTTNGYGKTKLISEKLLEMARSTRVSIIKPGFVIGTEAEGVPNTDDFVWRITAGCVAIGAFSMDEAESWMFVCGSDVFSKVVIDHLHCHEKTDPVKLLYGLTVEFWACVSEVTNQKLIPLLHNEWRSKLTENISMVGTRHPCWSILYMAQEATILSAIRPIQTPSEQSRTIEAVKNNIQYLVDIDYFSLSDSASCPNSADIFQRNKV
jgi:thioester reductase-like protein